MRYAVRLTPGRQVRLDDIPTDSTGGLSKEQGEKLAQELGAEVEELQEMLYAAADSSLLLVLQGRDTSGKDGAIRFLSNWVNMQGCRVASFKVPTAAELAHDFLWRVHPHTPGKGEMAVFNRSHYEDVLVVRVHDLAAEDVWRARYGHINAFEQLLSDAGTLVVKCFLHISKREQERRLLDREKEAVKSWKLSVGDWEERRHWDSYTRAYEDALRECGTPTAPWHVIPADHKWYRNLAIAEVLAHTMRPHRERWMRLLEERGAKARAELEAFRKT